MIKKKLSINAKKIDKFLIKYLKNQKDSLLINPMKYGVISLATLRQDLVDWRHLYAAGRLHKPVNILRNDGSVDNALRQNLCSAVSVALLLLPDEFSEMELYTTIASLSYTGDPRVGIGEHPDKVKNIVVPVLSAFRSLYQKPLAKVGPLVQLHEASANQGRIFRQVNSLDSRRELFESYFPSNLRTGVEQKLIAKPTDLVGTRNIVTSALRRIVSVSARRQSFKGVMTAGLLKGVIYAGKKIGKRFL